MHFVRVHTQQFLVHVSTQTGGTGGGFFLTCEDLGKIFDHPFSACTFFFSFFVFEVEISWYTQDPLFMLGSVHSGSASRDDCGRMFPDELGVSSLPDRFPHYAWTAA